MLFTTPTQWLALAVALIAGWLFGLASHPGGRKWKQRYAEERDIHGRTRKDYDTRLAERDARVAELERENARLTSATAPVVAPVTAVSHAPLTQSAARPARTRARWFDWNDRVDTRR